MFRSSAFILCCTLALCSLAPLPAHAQPACDDFNECTTAGMCLPTGMCVPGAPVPDGAPCTGVLEACITNPTCQDGICAGGIPAASGTPCRLLNSPCFTEGQCFTVPEVNLSFCMDSLPVECPDDGDPCTLEFCNPNSGACESFPKCFETECATAQCNSSTGACITTARNEGAPCDDFNECTPNDRCHAGECVAGSAVEQTPTATATASATAAAATATATATAAATATATVPGTHAMPTTTPTQGTACVGDCNDDESVTVDELLLAVNIALDLLDVDACRAGDANGDNAITVDEILFAVNNVLSGCA